MKKLISLILVYVMFGISLSSGQVIRISGGTTKGGRTTGNPPLAPLLIDTNSPLPNGSQSIAYPAFTFVAIGGSTVYTLWTITSGSVPAGMTFHTTTGILDGTPTGTGASVFFLTVTDSLGNVSTPPKSFTINISGAGSCGPVNTPPYQCSRTDVNRVNSGGSPGTYALPNAGGINGCGTNMTDADFGNPIHRATCATTPITVNNSMVTAGSGSGEENLSNMDTSLIVLQEVGNRTYPLATCIVTSSFCTTQYLSKRLYALWPAYSAQGGMLLDSGTSPAGNGSGDPTPLEWSWGLPYTGYTFGAQIYSWNFTGYDCTSACPPSGLNNYATPPTKVLVKDFTWSAGSTHCLPNGFGTPTHNILGGNSRDDKTFAMGYSNVGGQNTDINVVMYRNNPGGGQVGCIYYNTQTGAISGDWGTNGTVANPDRFKVHNVKVSGDGNWLRIEPAANTCSGTCSAHLYMLQIGTLTMNNCDLTCAGHNSLGNAKMFNNSGTPTGQVQVRNNATPNSPVALLPGIPTPGVFPGTSSGYCLTSQFDQHSNWSNSNSTDTNTVLADTDGDNTVYPYDCAWRREIIGRTSCTPGVGGCAPTTWRFGSEFVSGTNQIFDAEFAIGFVSQDGKWYFWTSDWWNPAGSPAETGTLGSGSGGSTCKGGPNWKASTAWGANFSIMPNTFNAGNYTYIFSGGTTGATNPANSGSPWPQTVGGTRTDNGGTWTNNDKGDCRVDVFYVGLQ